jgi:hypothetical protein
VERKSGRDGAGPQIVERGSISSWGDSARGTEISVTCELTSKSPWVNEDILELGSAFEVQKAVSRERRSIIPVKATLCYTKLHCLREALSASGNKLEVPVEAE